MSLEPHGDPAAPADLAARDEKLLPLVGWITYICGLGLVGLVIAYVDRGNARFLVRENYTYMIRTFWIGLFYAIGPLGAYTAFTLHVMGILRAGPEAGFQSIEMGPGSVDHWMVDAFAMQGVFLVISLWFFARCIRGLVSLVREVPILRPKTWFV